MRNNPDDFRIRVAITCKLENISNWPAIETVDECATGVTFTGLLLADNLEEIEKDVLVRSIESIRKYWEKNWFKKMGIKIKDDKNDCTSHRKV
jgi:hypothetical protein